MKYGKSLSKFYPSFSFQSQGIPRILIPAKPLQEREISGKVQLVKKPEAQGKKDGMEGRNKVTNPIRLKIRRGL